MLDNDRGGLQEFSGNAARGFQIDKVVVGKFFSLKLLRRCQSCRRFSRGNIKRSGLVRIFTVAQWLLTFERKIHALWQSLFRDDCSMTTCDRETFQFSGDHSVVARCGGKNFSRQFELCCERGLAIRFKFRGHATVVGGIGYNRDAFPVLCRRAQHRGTADIDIFDELFRSESGFGRSGLKGIKIHDHKIDRRDAVFRRLLLVFRKVAPVEQAAMNFWMKRLDAAAKHFRPAGKFRNVFYDDSGIPQQFGSAAG